MQEFVWRESASHGFWGDTDTIDRSLMVPVTVDLR